MRSESTTSPSTANGTTLRVARPAMLVGGTALAAFALCWATTVEAEGLGLPVGGIWVVAALAAVGAALVVPRSTRLAGLGVLLGQAGYWVVLLAALSRGLGE